MEFLYHDWLGTPLWMWLGFIGIVAALLALDIGVLHRTQRPIGARESVLMSAFYIFLGLSFGGWVGWYMGPTAGINYVTGFVIEKSLAMDNVFVIAMIFTYFAIPREYQHRVLFWGVLGVLVLRAIMIGFGTAIVAQFGWVLYIFAAFLIVTGVRMWALADRQYDVGASPVLRWVRKRFNVTDRFCGGQFWVRLPSAEGARPGVFMTPLFLSLVMIEIVDVIFAVDSVPAIFAITTDPFIVYTSNIFAVLGLRALYFALAAMVHRFRYLKYALSVLLIFIGSKIFVADALGIDKIPPLASLTVTFAILAGGVGYSLWKTGDAAESRLAR